MRYLRTTLAIMILAATVCGAAWARDDVALEEQTHKMGGAAAACGLAAGGLEIISTLASIGTTAPSESTQRTHLETIIYLLEGYGGPDVTLKTWPREVTAPVSMTMLMYLDDRSEIRAGGVVGAIAEGQALLEESARFVRQHEPALYAYYEAKYVWEGDFTMDVQLAIDAQLARIDFYWQQMAELARFSLETALATRQDADPRAAETALLKITAFCSAAVGYPGTVPTPGSNHGTAGVNGDVACVFSFWNWEQRTLQEDLFQAFLASDG